MVRAVSGEHYGNGSADFDPGIFYGRMAGEFDSGDTGRSAGAGGNLSIAICRDEFAADSGMARRGTELRDGGLAERESLQRTLVVSEPVHDSVVVVGAKNLCALRRNQLPR